MIKILFSMLSFLIFVYPAFGDTVIVQRGDTLQKISMRYFGTTRKWPEILKLNAAQIKESNNIEVGQKIIVTPEVTVSVESAPASTHIVTALPGDTLQKISMRCFGTTRKWQQILKSNALQIKNPEVITVGQQLIVDPDSVVSVGKTAVLAAPTTVSSTRKIAGVYPTVEKDTITDLVIDSPDELVNKPEPSSAATEAAPATITPVATETPDQQVVPADTELKAYHDLEL